MSSPMAFPAVDEHPCIAALTCGEENLRRAGSQKMRYVRSRNCTLLHTRSATWHTACLHAEVPIQRGRAMATRKAKKITKKKAGAAKTGAAKKSVRKSVASSSPAKKRSSPKKTSAKKKAPARTAPAKAKPVAKKKSRALKLVRKAGTKSASRKTAKALPAAKRASGAAATTKAASRNMSSRTAAKPVAAREHASSAGPKKALAQTARAKPSVQPAQRAASTPNRQSAGKTPSRSPAPAISADEKKRLAAQHLWELVEQKKRQAAQVPAWQTIVHHDHPTPPASPGPAAAENGIANPIRDTHVRGDRSGD